RAHHRARAGRWRGIRRPPPTRADAAWTKLSSGKCRRHSAGPGAIILNHQQRRVIGEAEWADEARERQRHGQPLRPPHVGAGHGGRVGGDGGGRRQVGEDAEVESEWITRPPTMVMEQESWW